MTFGHIISGPVDTIVELGMPIAIFIALYWWSHRKEWAEKK